MAHPDNDPDPNQDLFPARMELNPPPDGVTARARTAAQILYRSDARKAMAAVLERERPDVVHLHNIYHQLSPSILRPLAARGTPAVMTLHDYKLICPTYQLLDHGRICEACVPGKFRNAVRRRCNEGSLAGSALSALELRVHTSTDAYGHIGAFLCPSAFLRDKMVSGRVHPERMHHLPNFCDLSGVAAAQSPGHGVVYAGRLSHEKGVDTLVRAAALMTDGQPVVIAGDGPDRASLERLTAETGVAERVRFTGRVPMAALHEQMRAASAVVVPSRWYENQPMTVLEAYGCGRPVIASDLGGLSEQVVHGRTGLLVPHDDPAALAAAIDELANDPGRTHRMGLDARARAQELYAIDRHAEQVARVYQSLIHRP